jgi:hypothetical protein
VYILGRPLRLAFEVVHLEAHGSSCCFASWLSWCVEVRRGNHLYPEVEGMVLGNRYEHTQYLTRCPSVEHSIRNFGQIQRTIL